MRIELSGQGEPIPLVAIPVAGVDTGVTAITLLPDDGETFTPGDYISFGYTNYEAWCVGGAGGRGAQVPFVTPGQAPGTPGFSYGGAGGGGGLHNVSGLLEDLSDSLVVIGQAGDEGIDGGYSSFGTVCQASGGKAGEAGPNGNGGDGGAGGRIIIGGGATGGLIDTSDPNPHNWIATDAEDGSWDGTIGEGGGGGWGGSFDPPYYQSFPPGGGAFIDSFLMHSVHSAEYFFTHLPDIDGAFEIEGMTVIGGKGGKGSFSFGDTFVFGPGELAKHPDNEVDVYWAGSTHTYQKGASIPGCGGGAKPDSVSGFGSNLPGFNPNGLVRIRLYRVS